MIGRGIATVGIWFSPVALFLAVANSPGGTEVSVKVPGGLFLLYAMLMCIATLLVWMGTEE